MHYTLEMRTSLGGLNWTYDFTMVGSIEVVIEWVERTLLHDKAARGSDAMEFVLWSRDDPSGPPIACFKLEAKVTRTK